MIPAIRSFRCRLFIIWEKRGNVMPFDLCLSSELTHVPYLLTSVHDIAIMAHTFHITQKMLNWNVFWIKNIQVNRLKIHNFNQRTIVHADVQFLELRGNGKTFLNWFNVLCGRMITVCVQTFSREMNRPRTNSNNWFSSVCVKPLKIKWASIDGLIGFQSNAHQRTFVGNPVRIFPYLCIGRIFCVLCLNRHGRYNWHDKIACIPCKISPYFPYDIASNVCRVLSGGNKIQLNYRIDWINHIKWMEWFTRFLSLYWSDPETLAILKFGRLCGPTSLSRWVYIVLSRFEFSR